VHSDINPGNILITKDGAARLGDFGITGVITDPTVVEPGSTTTSKPGVVRYMAPELLNPTQFELQNSNPSKESDVYSLVMTAYETLTEILPFGNARDGIIIFHVVSGDRPSRPESAEWMKDRVWAMITTCWSEKRENRWDIRTVHNQLLVSSIQENAKAGRDIQTTARISNFIEEEAPAKDLPAVPPTIQVEDGGPEVPPDPSVRQSTKSKRLPALRKQLRSYTAPILGTPKTKPPIRSPTSPFPTTGFGIEEQTVDFPPQGRRRRKTALLASLGWKPLRAVVTALGKFLRLKRFRKTDSSQ